MYARLRGRGFEILAFPCNQFGGQEPGSNDVIRDTARAYGAEFRFFDKIDVNGPRAHPLYRFLKQRATGVLGQGIKWNFTKFLVDRNGQPVRRYGPPTAPRAVYDDIIELLDK